MRRLIVAIQELISGEPEVLSQEEGLPTASMELEGYVPGHTLGFEQFVQANPEVLQSIKDHKMK